MPPMMGPSCTINPESGTDIYLNTIDKAKNEKTVLIVGGGTAGLSAAVYAHDLGHKVVLLEKTADLGGLIRFADVDIHKADIKQFKEDLISRVKNRNIQVRMNTEISPNIIAELQPDVIFAAVGSSPIKVPIPGIDGENVMQALDAYYHPEKLGKKIVMIGGGLVGCETGLHLAETGHDVTIIEMRDELAPDAYRLHRVMLLDRLSKEVKSFTGYRCTAITADGVTAQAADGSETLFEADTVVYAMGMKANTDTVEKIRAMAGATPVVVFGDGDHADKIINAVKGAMDAVLAL